MKNMITGPLQMLKQLHPFQLWVYCIVISVIFTLIIVGAMDLFLHGELSNDYMLTGLVASFFVATSVVTVLTVIFSKQKEDEILLGLYRMVAEHASCAIVLVDPRTHAVLYCNREFLLLTGYALDELLGLEFPTSGNLTGVFSESMKGRIRQFLYNEQGWSGQIQIQSKAGTTLTSDGRIREFESKGASPVWIIYLQDV